MTDPEKECNRIYNMPIIGIADFIPSKETGIIISVGKKYQLEVEEELKKRKIESYILF